MTCTSCERSKGDPTNDVFWAAHCVGCKARALASVGVFSDEVDCDQLTPGYRETLERLFGASWRLGHAKVSEWHSRINVARAAKATKP